ncbi:HAMP domain-containing protein [Pseudomonas sp. ODNR1LW]|nr:HAMP domain-containing protein [Pseudomonas sp. ODNR1LW]
MRFADISISKRLALAVLLPLLAMTCLAGAQVANLWSHYRQMTDVVLVGDNIKILDGVIHSLQVERGLTAGFLGSGGRNGKDKVTDARAKADAAMARYQDFMDAVATLQDPRVDAAVAEAGAKLQQVVANRRQIDALAFKPKQSFQAYTAAIADLADVVSTLAVRGQGSKIEAELIAYIQLLGAKELAGQERGTGNGLINAGQAEPRQIYDFSQMAGAQNALLNAFLSAQPADVRDHYSQVLATPLSPQIDAARQRIAASQGSAALAEISAPQWFAATTQRIEAMKTLQTESLSRLGATAQAVAQEARRLLTIASALTVIGCLAMMALSAVIAMSIVNPLKILIDAMKKLDAGVLEPIRAGVERKDEIGDMARAVDTFRQSAIRNRELEAEAVAARERAERDRIELQQRVEAEAEDRLNRATGALAAGLRRLADGDLLCEIVEPFAPRFEALRHDFNSSVGQLREALLKVGQSVGVVNNGAGEVSSASDDLARRTERQAASLEQTAAALEEITSQIAETSRRSGDARQVTRAASCQADKSGVIVHDACAAMERIEDSAQQINQIIGVIDEIAFQTNLLALNAGVEAARAGEAGRGFAVVASEVRALAQRSAEAAKEIKTLIGNSGAAVAEGVRLVQNTGEGLTAIVRLVETLSAHMDQIANAAVSQSASLAEVTTAINQMDQTTQQNAAMVEEMNAAGVGLAQESGLLDSLVRNFRLTATVAASGPPERELKYA